MSGTANNAPWTVEIDNRNLFVGQLKQRGEGIWDIVYMTEYGSTMTDEANAKTLANANLIVKLRNDYASGALIDPTCHHYEGIKCFHTKDCSIDKKRERCPFDDHQSGALVEAPTCPACDGSGEFPHQINASDIEASTRGYTPPIADACQQCKGTGYEPMVPRSRLFAECRAASKLYDSRYDEGFEAAKREMVPLSKVDSLINGARLEAIAERDAAWEPMRRMVSDIKCILADPMYKADARAVLDSLKEKETA